MTREAAKTLLDHIREGANAPAYLIDAALRATGDLPEPRVYTYGKSEKETDNFKHE